LIGTGNSAADAAISTSNMSKLSTIYVGVRPTNTVVNTSGNGVSPIQVWTWDDWTFSVGDHVTVSSVSGNTAANVTGAVVTAVYPAQGWWLFTPGDSWGTGHDQLAGLVVTGGNTCTINMNNMNHNLNVGQPIYVNGGWPTGAPAEGIYNVSAIVSRTAFSFPCTATNGTYTTDQSSRVHAALRVLPSFTVSGTGNGAYSNTCSSTFSTCGQITGTDDTKNFSQIIFTPGGSLGPVTLAPPVNPCDLNGDGLVNSSDVSLSMSMALGQITCNGGLQGLGTCNVIDTQRVINAADGGSCQTGP
jgi:hypothetical protein